MMHPIAIYRHAKNQNFLMTGFGENVQKPNFYHINPLNPKTFSTLSTPNFMQSFRKTNEASMRYLKTDRQTDGPIDW